MNNSTVMTLEDIIAKLQQHDNVSALLLCGSTATGRKSKKSDYDLAIVVKEKPANLISMFAYIDNVPADVFFYALKDIERMVETKKAEEGAGTWLIHWLKSGKVAFDKSGALAKLQESQHSIRHPSNGLAAKRLAYKINYNLVNNYRYFESNDSLYHAALEIRLTYSIIEAFTGYFALRNLYWEGEKAAVLYLRENDSEYLQLFEIVNRASTLKDRFTAYKSLVDKTFNSEYPKWNKDIVASPEGDFTWFWKSITV